MVSSVFGVQNRFWTLYDGLTKQEIVKTATSIKDPEGYAEGKDLGANALAKDGEEVIRRLMSSP